MVQLGPTWYREPAAEQRGGSSSDGVFLGFDDQYFFASNLIEKGGQGGWLAEALVCKGAQ